MGRRKKQAWREKYGWVFDYRGRSNRRSIYMNNYTQKQQGEEGKGGKGFFSCYLLTSLSRRHKGHTYIGFTVNPRRRIRQHNGEIGSGAASTKKKRPWEMVMCIYGFPTKVSALQFEWAWQHPTESLVVCKAAATFKSLSGLRNKIKLAFTMFALSKWEKLDLNVSFFSSNYTKHLGSSTVPEWINVQICSMDELPCYTGIYNTHDNDYEVEFRDNDEDNDSVDESGTKYAYTNVVETIEVDRIDDDLDAYELVEETGNKGTPSNERLANITVESDLYDFKGIEDSFNGFFDFGIYNDDPEDDLMSPEDLFNNSTEDSDQLHFAKENMVEIDHETKKVDSPIACEEVEVVDLLSPSPDYYRVDLNPKTRKVSREVIDLTRSPIFVER